MLERVAETKIWQWLHEDRLNYDMAKTICSFACNLGYALLNLAIAMISSSTWHASVSAFLTVLGLMRLSMIIIWKANRGTRAVRCTGFMMLILDAVLLFMVYQTASQKAAAGRHGDIVMITIATYTFFKLGSAIAKAIKARADSCPIAISIRSIIYAETAISIVNLQRSMIASFGASSIAWETMMNTLTGISACIFIAVIGISLIRKQYI